MNTAESVLRILQIMFATCDVGIGVADTVCANPPPPPPTIRYYEPGKACYIQGVFHESCPKQEWQK